MRRLMKPLPLTCLALFALAFVVYAIAWPEAPVIKSDTAGYLRAANAIAHGSTNPERPPGYPLLLLATGSSESPTRALFYVSLLLHFASVSLIAAVLSSIGLPLVWVVLACAIMVLPPYVQMTAFALAETLGAFCIAVLFWSLYSYWRRPRLGFLLLASFAAGFGATTKPTFEFVAFALAGALAALTIVLKPHGWTWRRALRDAVILAAGTILIAGSRSAVNYARSGFFGQTSLLGYTLAGRTCTLWEQIPDPTVRKILVDARQAAYVRGQNLSWSVFTVQPALMKATGKSEEELGTYLEAMSIRLIRSHPEAYLEDGARGFAEFWFPMSGGLPLLRSSLARLAWYALSWSVFLAFAGSLALGAGMIVRSVVEGASPRTIDAGLAAAWLVAVVIVTYTAVVSSAVAWGDSRFRAAVDLVVVATVAITAEILRRVRAGRRREAAPDRRTLATSVA